MKYFVSILVTLSAIFAFVVYDKGSDSNLAPDGSEIEPMTIKDKMLRGLDLTLEGAKETIKSTRIEPEVVVKPKFVGENMPDSSKMMDYSNPGGLSNFTAELQPRRGLFNHVE